MFLPENHISLTAHKKLREIAEPVFKFFNLHDLGFCRFYASPQGNKISLPFYTDPDHLRTALGSVGASSTLEVLGKGREMFIFHKMVEEIQHAPSRRIYEGVVKIQRETFGLGIEFTLRRYYPTHTDNFDFIAKRDDPAALNRFLNHIDLLQHFIDYFYDKAAHLLEEGAKQKLVYPVYEESVAVETHQEDEEKWRREFMEALPIQSFRFQNALGELAILTAKELLCAQQLIRGKTSKEIACALNLSPRTVETHVESIKRKSGCYSKSKAIQLLLKQKMPYS